MQEPNSTKDTVLDAAADTFAEKGFSGARMDEIAKRAGVNKATIYYQVGDKEALYEAVLKRTFTAVGEDVSSIVTQSAPADEKFSGFLHAVAAHFDANPYLPRIVLQELSTGATRLPDNVVGMMAGIINAMGKILAEGVSAGIFRPVKTETIYFTMITSYMMFNVSAPVRTRVSVATSQMQTKSGKLTDGYVNDLVQLLLQAIKI